MLAWSPVGPWPPCCHREIVLAQVSWEGKLAIDKLQEAHGPALPAANTGPGRG